MMVQAESAAKIIEPGKVYTSNGVLLVNTTVKCPLASGVKPCQKMSTRRYGSTQGAAPWNTRWTMPIEP